MRVSSSVVALLLPFLALNVQGKRKEVTHFTAHSCYGRALTGKDVSGKFDELKSNYDTCFRASNFTKSEEKVFQKAAEANSDIILEMRNLQKTGRDMMALKELPKGLDVEQLFKCAFDTIAELSSDDKFRAIMASKRDTVLRCLF